MFCVRPFIELTLHHDGNITPCCHLFDYTVGTIKDNSLEDLWNSEKMQSLRREFLSGNIKTCTENIKAFNCHQDDDDHFLPFIEKSEVIKSPIKKLDLRLNGKCNLECIMCDVWRGPNNLYDETSFWRDGPEHIFPHLKEIDLLGGEPFIQKDTFKLIDQVSSINPDCEWSFTTNGHWSANGTILEALNKIKIKRMTVSVDSIFPDTFKKIRIKGDLSKLLNNLKILKKIQDDTDNIQELRLNFLLQKYNYLELKQFVEYCEIKNYSYVSLILKNPNSLSLFSLEKEELMNWNDDLKSFISEKKSREYLTDITKNVDIFLEN